MTEQHTEMLSTAYAARGYLVLARLDGEPPLETGSIVNYAAMCADMRTVVDVVTQPMRVVGETTADDFIAQQKLWRMDPVIDPEYSRFYRLESD